MTREEQNELSKGAQERREKFLRDCLADPRIIELMQKRRTELLNEARRIKSKEG